MIGRRALLAAFAAAPGARAATALAGADHPHAAGPPRASGDPRATGAPLAAGTVPAATGRVVDVRAYGATGDGRTDDGPAIARAVSALTAGATLLLPPGTYRVSRYVNIQGTSGVTVSGAGAALRSSGLTDPVLVLYGNSHLTVTGLDVAHTSTAPGRTGGGFGIKTANGSDVVLRGCTVHDTTAAGIVTQSSTRVTVADCSVRDTLADGIHTTGCSTHVTVTGNTVVRTGDDGISVVSYRADGPPCSGVTVTGNTVAGSAARGIDVVGGSDVTITGNAVTGTRAAGIMLAQETSYSTHGVSAVTISGNTVVDAATVAGTPVAHSAVMVHCADPAHPVTGVTITGNSVRTPRLGAFSVAGESAGVRSVVVAGNVFLGPSRTSGQTGYAVTAGTGVQVRDNTASDPSGGGFAVSGPARATVTGNTAHRVPSGYRGFALSSATTASGNRTD